MSPTMQYALKNERTGETVAGKAVLASSPLTRMKGLLGRKTLPRDEAIILRPASSIHTHFMRFALDVIYLDSEGEILKIVPNLVPFRFSAARRAHTVIEMVAGALSDKDLRVGDRLLFTSELEDVSQRT